MIILKILLWILAGIFILLGLVLSFHIKVYLRLDDELHLRAGLGPIVLKLAPKKPPKPVDLRDYTYEKHQKRLEKDRKAALKKKEKAAAKAEKKRQDKLLAEKAEAAQAAIEEAENAPDEVKLFTVFEIIEFAVTELGRFASYMKTDVRMLSVTVGGKDPEKTAKTYGTLCAAVPLLLEFLEAKTSMHALRPNTIDLNADFTSEKIRFRVDFRFRLRLFSIVRIGWHTLVWFIKAKIRQSQVMAAK